MPLYKLRLPAADASAAEHAAGLLGGPPAPEALAVTLFEHHPPRFLVEAYYPDAPSLAAVNSVLAGQAGIGEPTVETVPDANWVALSQASLPPVAAGRFVVHGAHDRPRFAMRRLAIEIEAGEAFGTAHNATTVLCLEALDRLARRRRFSNVLDLGCGTGVLAIAAARILPGANVFATDNDPVAVVIARDNVRLNRLAQRVHVAAAAGLAHPRLRGERIFGLVLSNLLPGPLIALAPDLRRTMAVGGVAVLCGLLNHQAREVSGTYCAAGFRLLQRRQAAGWTALILEKVR